MSDDVRREAAPEPATVELLRQAHARASERAPEQHPDRSPDCLSFAALDAALERGFTGAHRRHAATCPFCQKLVTMAFRVECPSVGLVLSHLAASSPIAPAMVQHVENDGCRRCLRLTNSRLLRALAARLPNLDDASPAQVDPARAAVDFGFLPAVVGAFAPSPWASAPGQPPGVEATEGDEGEFRWPFRLRATAPGGMSATLRQTDRDTLVVHIQSDDPADAGRTVDVEVAGEGESLEASVVLAGRGRRCEGLHTFGRLADLRPYLGGSCALVVAFRDEPSSHRDEPSSHRRT